MRKLSTVALLTAAAVSFAAADAAAQAWPTRQAIRIVVPFAPGGSGDFSVRMIAEPLRIALGQTVVVENKVGAGGNIGSESVARSAPDGYTLLMATDGFGLIPHLYKSLPFDPMKDFAPIIQLTRQPILLAAHPSTGVASAQELIPAAKKAGGLGYATSGVGTQQHLIGEIFMSVTGAPMNHVPYRGGGQAITDFIGGQVPVAVLGSTPLYQHYKAGTIKVLAQSTKGRSPALPDVPTFAEAGVQGIQVEQWLGIVAPAKTPPDILARLNGEIGKILADPAIRERFLAQAIEPVGGSIQQFSAQIDDDYKRYGGLVKQFNIKVE
jgi:tripartite-type tricarboxylate transporter receptor subunit TctC